MARLYRLGAAFLAILLSMGSAVSAQDADNAEAIQSLTDERREILLYGIDSQVLELIDDLREERDTSLIGEVYAAFKMTRNPRVKASILSFLQEMEFRGADEDALAIVEDFDDRDPELLLSAVRYLSDGASPEHATALKPLLESQNLEVVRAAVKAVGLAGGEGTGELLLSYLEDRDFPERIKPEIILALGDLKDPSVIPALVDILENTGEESTWRRYACASLGKIGDPSVLPVIESVLFDEDANLRAYAVGALRYFDTDDIVPMLIAGLKDSFWRVRVSAAQGLGEKRAVQATPILIFKAEKDPEMNVRQQAVRALGEIADTEAFEFLRSYYERDVTPLGLRILAAEILAEKNLSESLEVFKKVIFENWERENSKILERSAYFLSLAESPELEGLYSKFLDSGELVIIIYGIRGVARNDMGSLKGRIEQFAEEGNHRSIRKAALAALDQMG
jgi:HEAT repeat protein